MVFELLFNYNSTISTTMLTVYLYTISSAIIISGLSLIGIFIMGVKEKKIKTITSFLVSLSTGALLADSFLHLMPEAIERNNGNISVWLYLLSGIISFFILEKIVCWRHCHVPTSENHPHPLGMMNLIGDGVHNFIDGIIIAGSFLVSVPVGIATSVAIVAHEIPQEIADFGVLLHAGYTKSKALFFNLISGAISVLGAILALTIGGLSENFIAVIIPFAAGGFIYIATADLIPELHKETKISKSIKQLLGILVGIVIMLALKIYFE